MAKQRYGPRTLDVVDAAKRWRDSKFIVADECTPEEIELAYAVDALEEARKRSGSRRGRG